MCICIFYIWFSPVRGCSPWRTCRTRLRNRAELPGGVLLEGPATCSLLNFSRAGYTVISATHVSTNHSNYMNFSFPFQVSLANMTSLSFIAIPCPTTTAWQHPTAFTRRFRPWAPFPRRRTPLGILPFPLFLALELDQRWSCRPGPEPAVRATCRQRSWCPRCKPRTDDRPHKEKTGLSTIRPYVSRVCCGREGCSNHVLVSPEANASVQPILGTGGLENGLHSRRWALDSTTALATKRASR